MTKFVVNINKMKELLTDYWIDVFCRQFLSTNNLFCASTEMFSKSS